MMKQNFKSEINKAFPDKLKTNEILSPYATFKIGGPAEYFLEINSKEELQKALILAKKFKVPVFILGGGSNILISDNGFKGLVLKNRIDFIKVLAIKGILNVVSPKLANKPWETEDVLLEVGSGTMINKLVRYSIKEGLEGIEDFLGLPGTVGGAIKNNSHWQKKHIKDYLIDVKLEEEVVVSGIFTLKKNNDVTGLWRKAEESMRLRQEKQPLDYSSAGCIFKNINQEKASELQTPNLTLSAGFLIDQCGLKGKQVGQAQISTKHANFIINRGQASAEDVLKLINLIKEKVKNKYNFSLKEEIEYLGF